MEPCLNTKVSLHNGMLELLKESDLHLDPLTPLDCYSWAKYKLNDYVIHNMHSDPLHEKNTLRSISLFLEHIYRTFKCIDMRKQNIT